MPIPSRKPRFKTGVYCILNKINGKRYVGSAARSITERRCKHVDALRDGNHPNRYLQNAWDKNGSANFVFLVLERCSSNKCIEREQYWINHYQSANREKGYNISPTAGSCLGVKQTEETRRKLSERMKGTKQSDETIQKRVNSWKSTVLTEEGLKRWSERRRGKKRTEEGRKRMSDSRKGRPLSQLNRDGLREAWKKRSPPLPIETIEEVLLLLENGFSQRKIADRLNIPQMTVCNINRGTYRGLK